MLVVRRGYCQDIQQLLLKYPWFVPPPYFVGNGVSGFTTILIGGHLLLPFFNKRSCFRIETNKYLI